MKILLDKEFKEIKETIEMYKDKYNEALEDYYRLNKKYENLNDLLCKFQSKNQKLRNKLEEKNKILNEAIEYMEHYIEMEDAPINERIKIEFKELLNILKGSEK